MTPTLAPYWRAWSGPEPDANAREAAAALMVGWCRRSSSWSMTSSCTMRAVCSSSNAAPTDSTTGSGSGAG